MTARRRAILIVSLALLLLAIVIFAIVSFWPKPPAPATPAEPTSTTETAAPAAPAAPAKNPLNPAPTAVEAAPGTTAAVQVAEFFAERYGSYSNQGDFQNLRDLLPIMTASYRAKTEAYLATATPADIANYQGITSVKISSEIRSYSAAAGTAVVAVMLQQQKTTGTSPTPAISYRSLKVGLKLVGQEWKVDSADWEN